MKLNRFALGSTKAGLNKLKTHLHGKVLGHLYEVGEFIVVGPAHDDAVDFDREVPVWTGGGGEHYVREVLGALRFSLTCKTDTELNNILMNLQL